MPMLRFVAQSNTSRSAERLGRRIWHARVRPSESRPKMKNLFLRIRNGINGPIAPDSALAFDTKKALRVCGVSKKTSPRQFDLRLMAANCFAFYGGLQFG